MADVYRAYACTEREALERLAAEAELGPERLSRIRVDFDATIHRRITLWIPDVVGQPQPPESAGGVDAATARVLQQNGCEVVIPPSQACCGAIHYHSGVEEPALALAKQVGPKGEVVGINAMIVGGDQSVSIAASVANDFVTKATQNGTSVNKKAEPTPSDVI